MSSESVSEKNTRLITRGKRGLLRVVFSRTGVVALLILLQIGVVVAILRYFGSYWPHYYAVLSALSLLMGVYLINTDSPSFYKTSWLLFLALAPVAAVPLYFYIKLDVGHRRLASRLRKITQASSHAIPLTAAGRRLKEESPADATLARYLRDAGGFPVYDRTAVDYYPSGEDFFPAFLEALESAQRFIFLEYFIIDQGEMWDKVLEILTRKADRGVDVRLIYDGTCEFFRLPRSYAGSLRARNIQCHVFAPVHPFVSTHYNYRDHRKIAVIDGRVAFTGGLNLADEYINRITLFGHWKDTAVRLRGEAVKTFTLLFLQLWQMDEKELQFEPYLSAPAEDHPEEQGFVIPYGDHPLDDQPVGQSVYLHILNQATRYVHIMTPYLILDSELESALKFAARRGVEVSVMLPHIPDKKLAFALAKSHYPSLIAAGVKVYEYTPGFVHAKSFVSDDVRAVVGTINLDYRSLFHHFECAAYFYKTACVAPVEEDYQKTLKQCRLVTRKEASHPGFFYKLMGILMKAFAPLM